jgi:hypothetical protein
MHFHDSGSAIWGLYSAPRTFLIREDTYPCTSREARYQGVLAVKHIGAAADRIESNVDGVNQKTVLRGLLYTAHNLAFPENLPR